MPREQNVEEKADHDAGRWRRAKPLWRLGGLERNRHPTPVDSRSFVSGASLLRPRAGPAGSFVMIQAKIGGRVLHLQSRARLDGVRDVGSFCRTLRQMSN